MKTEFLSPATLPGSQLIFLDFCRRLEDRHGQPSSGAVPGAPSALTRFYADWDPKNPAPPSCSIAPDRIAEPMLRLLAAQNPDPACQVSLNQLRNGARTVVTGQQVGLFGGAAMILYKAATAIAQAAEASAAGHPHQPIFWLASEDHDFAEINHLTLPDRRELVTRRYDAAPEHPVPVGRLALTKAIAPLVEQAQSLLGWSEIGEHLAAAYRPGVTLAEAFRAFYSRIFSRFGLLILDPAGREAHRQGAPVLRAAIERADEFHAALLERNRELESAGYHAQVAVAERSSLLFLIDAQTGARVALKRTPATAAEPAGIWQAGRLTLSTSELLGILDAEPERISPSALLRPVFQDFILPHSAYVGGPAEVAYFAQTAVLYEKLLGRITPVLPRFSATVVDATTAALLHRYDQAPERILGTDADTLRQSLAARAMPIETKRALASVGNALDQELTALTGHLAAMDANLGKAAVVSASKMRYQMNRLRRLAANHQLQRENSIARDAEAVVRAIFPQQAPQERVLASAAILSLAGEDFLDRVVREAANLTPGHRLLWL